MSKPHRTIVLFLLVALMLPSTVGCTSEPDKNKQARKTPIEPVTKSPASKPLSSIGASPGLPLRARVEAIVGRHELGRYKDDDLPQDEFFVGIELQTTDFNDSVAFRILKAMKESRPSAKRLQLAIFYPLPDGTGEGLTYSWRPEVGRLTRLGARLGRPTWDIPSEPEIEWVAQGVTPAVLDEAASGKELQREHGASPK